MMLFHSPPNLMLASICCILVIAYGLWFADAQHGIVLAASRFLPKSSSSPLIGEPVNAERDVGLAPTTTNRSKSSVLGLVHPLSGERTGRKETVDKRSDLSARPKWEPSGASHERESVAVSSLMPVCKHSKEVGLELPTVPNVFTSETALEGPYPASNVLPRDM